MRIPEVSFLKNAYQKFVRRVSRSLAVRRSVPQPDRLIALPDHLVTECPHCSYRRNWHILGGKLRPRISCRCGQGYWVFMEGEEMQIRKVRD